MTLEFGATTLQAMKAALGLKGRDAPTTDLEDAIVRQSIDVSRIASTSFGFGPGDGLFTGVIRQDHVAAGDLLETLDPYDPGTVIPPLPLVIPPELEWWFMGVGVFVGSTTQTIDEVQFGMAPKQVEGFSDSTNVGRLQVLARWDTVLATAGAGIIMTNSASGAAFQSPPFPIRWSRGMNMSVSSQTTGVGASSIDISSWWCLVRAGLSPNATA